ncbi:MAG: DNA mismatch repair protein [Ruminococcus sp.]|nr:DNA mismatch repair protein [Ruminococcus sp.]
MGSKGISILFPKSDAVFTQMSESAFHDLGLDSVCKALTSDAKEQKYISGIISNMTADVETARFRQEVFADILDLPQLRKKITELFERLEFMKSFGSLAKKTEEKLGIWYLLHRLDELDDYIKCVEAMRECLGDEGIRSQGLIRFREYINGIYEDSCFAQMRKDIGELKLKASEIRSVTIGVNVNDRFEATSMGLISVNSKPFKKSGIVGSFADALASKGGIKEDNEWNGDMRYHEVDRAANGSPGAIFQKGMGFLAMQSSGGFVDAKVRQTIVNMPEDDAMNSSTFYLEKVMNKMLDTLVKRLSDTLSKYVDVAVINISRLIPEFTYYIRFAEFIEKYSAAGFVFSQARAVSGERTMQARDFYNLRLALSVENASDIVFNDLDFDSEHTVYILTGANRGGKTTVTQAVGLLFALAQGGISVAARSFEYAPVDCIYTHFPADEDKTIDLGRLGEECVRFKQLYADCTADSLLLLNESFSTTSFEEGYFIARDSVRAILKKQVRTIYNTHMHKLAADVDDMNAQTVGAKAASLVVKSDGGKRSFKVEVAAPEGMSYARDIAQKYGVTYEMLTSG